MSLVSNYCRGTDGKMYQNPVLGEKDWFICFDDDDPEELVIKNTCKLTPHEIFKKIGMKYKNLYKNGSSGRMFDGDFHSARSYFFDAQNRINVDFITHSDGVVDPDTIFQGVIFDPKK